MSPETMPMPFIDPNLSPPHAVAALRPLLPCLELGVEGAWNQMRLAAAALHGMGRAPALLPVARGLLCWALQEHPLHGELLGLRRAAARHPELAGLPGADLFDAVAARFRKPADIHSWNELAAELPAPDAVERALPFLADSLRGEGGLFWLGEGIDALLDAGAFEAAAALVRAVPDSVPRPLAHRLAAEAALHSSCPEDAETAEKKLQVVDEECFGLWKHLGMLQLAHQCGDAAGQERALAALWRALPWHVNAALTLHDLAEPAARIDDHDTASVCILLYSWNKAGPLETTLASLRASDLGEARVVVLDNGSTDGTDAVVDKAAGGFRHFDQITLPVNVGAPAARNWLLSLPQVRDNAFAAFLDDDVLLPENWLAELLQAARAHPKAGAVGCRVTDHTAPHRMQAADFNLLPPELAAPSFADLEEQVHMANNGLGLRDNGLFAYSRPCVSVTGCCHLVRMEAIRAAGPFDVRFSPSQFDDLERDIRSFLHGYPAHYHGRVRIGHMQHSSLRQARTPASSAHVFGNRIKLEHLYEPGALAPVRAQADDMLWDDLNAKIAALHERYGETP